MAGHVSGLRKLAQALLLGVMVGGMAASLFASSAAAQVAPRPPAGGGGAAAGGGGGAGGAPRLPGGLLPGDIPGDGLGGPGTNGPAGAPQGSAPRAPDLICVVFRPGTPDGTGDDFARGLSLTVAKHYDMAGLGLRVFLMQLPAGVTVDDALKRATADGRALWVQPDFRFVSLDGGTAAPASRQYALTKIRALDLPPAARGQGVTVALIDSGVARDHESLKGDKLTVIDLVGESAAPPAETHGTALASIIAGSGKVQGLAPAADLLAIRAFTEVDPKSGTSNSDSFHVSQAISTALEHKARVVNMSIGGPSDPLVRMAVEQAVLTGVVVFAAAGNAGPDAPPVYPAAQTGVLAVTATDDKDRLYPGANRGDYVALAAPGVNVLAARPSKAGAPGYDYFTGTSMATGYATGLAAVLLSADPQLNAAGLRKILEQSAADLGAPKKDPEFGWGRIDAAAALAATPTVGAAN